MMRPIGNTTMTPGATDLHRRSQRSSPSTRTRLCWRTLETNTIWRQGVGRQNRPMELPEQHHILLQGSSGWARPSMGSKPAGQVRPGDVRSIDRNEAGKNASMAGRACKGWDRTYYVVASDHSLHSNRVLQRQKLTLLQLARICLPVVFRARFCCANLGSARCCVLAITSSSSEAMMPVLPQFFTAAVKTSFAITSSFCAPRGEHQGRKSATEMSQDTSGIVVAVPFMEPTCRWERPLQHHPEPTTFCSSPDWFVPPPADPVLPARGAEATRLLILLQAVAMLLMTTIRSWSMEFSAS